MTKIETLVHHQIQIQATRDVEPLGKKFQNINNKEILAASDAFFPFVDGIEKLVQNGVSGIIQPSGSIRDKEIINFANKTGTILVFSKSRHFKH